MLTDNNNNNNNNNINDFLHTHILKDQAQWCDKTNNVRVKSKIYSQNRPLLQIKCLVPYTP